jgi:predicted CXXCH cytochrome family protein
MARSFAPIAMVDELVDQAQSFQAAGFQFLVESRDGKIMHITRRLDSDSKILAQSEARISFVVGAGVRGRSYLINRGGYLYQSPISWYSERKVWDLSPHLGTSVDQLYRPVQPLCLYCHADRVDPVEQTGNRFREAIFRSQGIGCERCHGPGEWHVQRHQEEKSIPIEDEAIVNPSRLTPALREAVCQQCHLQGLVRISRRGQHMLDFRPGLPLNQFWSIFVKPAALDQQKKFSSEVEQMHASRCYQAGEGRLGCISCHDPHETPPKEKKASYYRKRCLACHQENSCGLSPGDRRNQSPGDSCTECHMKRRSSNLAHMASADHRIPRHPDTFEPPSPDSSGSWQSELERSPESALVLFQQDQVGRDDPEAARDLGLAFVDLAGLKLPVGVRRKLAQSALPLLTPSVQARPDDLPAGQGLGYTFWLLDRKPEALAAFEKTLAQAPRREEALVYAAGVSGQLGQTDRAIQYWRSALDVNPWSPRSHFELAKLLAQTKQWTQALAEVENAQELSPFQLEIRLLRIECHLRLGNVDEARAEFDNLLRFDPGKASAWQRWFDQIRK